VLLAALPGGIAEDKGAAGVAGRGRGVSGVKGQGGWFSRWWLLGLLPNLVLMILRYQGILILSAIRSPFYSTFPPERDGLDRARGGTIGFTQSDARYRAHRSGRAYEPMTPAHAPAQVANAPRRAMLGRALIKGVSSIVALLPQGRNLRRSQ